jgi:Fungal chitosanase of glycosyl hydrolase group 75
LRDEIESLKRYSFLIGATDPYIVLPSGLGKADGGKVGDYAVVIFGDRIFPAIVGDIGPSDKAGEASLRIAKEINANSGPNNRPVSDLKVTYLIFPGTAETPFGPPDLEKLQTRCEALVNEIGGAGTPLHHWENIIPPLPTPTPTPAPTPAPAPSATPLASTIPGASASASPAATFAFPIETPTP